MLEAEQMSGACPGSQAFLGSLQDTTTKIWSTLSAEDQQRYSNLATRWSDDAPPPHIQASDEANNLLDDGTHFLKYCPNWKDAPLFREWQKYAKMCFRGGDVHTTQKGPPKTVKPPISIHIKSNRCPNIPAITDADGYNAKAVQAVLQDYITTHIRYDTNVGGPNDSSNSESSSTSSSDDPSSSNANHSALPNSDDNSTEDEESENFDLEGSDPLQKWSRTSSPDHILEERQERQGHDKDYDSGPDDSGTFQSSPQGSSDESDHGKWQVKITERAKYMDTGRSVGGINTHFLQRDAPWFRQWCASGCSEMEENTPTYQNAEMYPGPMKGVQKWTYTL
ncbi:hypothetical protein BJY52DRAFT_1227093 [Lactarius psammicola]|nr:hypothetical protein BJY52DRAFT_1227093 [Lactarius psammicola]